ncbi:MAG: TetR/AcrR family transcriptional regulator, partial [Halieaceae bacterium]|nr:TetR/AcrR family transcriptional regulator [Halieaceae bacterium]
MASKPSVRTSKARDKIVKQASLLFSKLGYTGTTMRDIAVNVGVLPGSLYAHIKSKEELLLEIVSSGIESFLQIEVAARAMSGTAEEKLRYAVGRHIEVVAEDPAKMLIVFHQWRYLTPPNLSRAKKMRRRYAQFYRDLLKEGIAAGEFSSELDSKVEVLAIMGALNWTPEWYRHGGAYSPAEIGAKIAD